MQKILHSLSFVVCLGLVLSPACLLAASPKAIKTIRAVGPEGLGNSEAAAAWQELSKAEAKSLVDILEAMDGANELALNWLRAADGRNESRWRKAWRSENLRFEI
jgi:hypothetical protein